MGPAQAASAVLVVDDDPVLAGLISRGLSGAGYEVGEAIDGNKALKALETKTYDAVVIDIIMPDREGVETIIEIRERWPGIKIIAMSGGGRMDPDMFLNLASTFGADALLKKPFRLRELLELLPPIGAVAPSAPTPPA
jgi:DNA-binding response OmpR family regulator